MAAAYVLEDGGKPKHRALRESFVRSSRMAEVTQHCQPFSEMSQEYHVLSRANRPSPCAFRKTSCRSR